MGVEFRAGEEDAFGRGGHKERYEYTASERKGIQHSTGSSAPGASGICLSVSFGKFSGGVHCMPTPGVEIVSWAEIRK